MKKVIINLFVIFCMVITPISSFAIENKTLNKIDMYSGPAGSYSWYLTDEFSGYLMTSNNSFPASIVSKEIITVEEFINNF